MRWCNWWSVSRSVTTHFTNKFFLQIFLWPTNNFLSIFLCMCLQCHNEIHLSNFDNCLQQCFKNLKTMCLRLTHEKPRLLASLARGHTTTSTAGTAHRLMRFGVELFPKVLNFCLASCGSSHATPTYGPDKLYLSWHTTNTISQRVPLKCDWARLRHDRHTWHKGQASDNIAI